MSPSSRDVGIPLIHVRLHLLPYQPMMQLVSGIFFNQAIFLTEVNSGKYFVTISYVS